MNAQTIHVARVNVGGRRRRVDRAQVKGIADSMKEIGLLNPITVRAEGDQFTEFTLVAGHHRLEAAKLLGWQKIPAVIVELDDVDRALAEIDENLIRNDLSDLERSEHLKARKDLYLLKHPETARGGDQRSAAARSKRNDFVSFATDTAQKTGRTERAIQQDVQIAESIPDDVRDAIRATPLAESKTDLLEMARLPEEGQREIVQTTDLTDKAAVRQAIAERKPSARHAPDPAVGDDYVDDVNQDPGDDIPVDADPDGDAPPTGRGGEGGAETGVPTVPAPGAASASAVPPAMVAPSERPDPSLPGDGTSPAVAAALDAGPTTSEQPADHPAGRAASAADEIPPASSTPAPAATLRTNGHATTFSDGVGATRAKGSHRAVTAGSFSDRALDAGDLARALLDNGAAVVKDAILENATPAQLNALRIALNATDGQPSPTTAGAPTIAEVKAQISRLETGRASVASHAFGLLTPDEQRRHVEMALTVVGDPELVAKARRLGAA